MLQIQHNLNITQFNTLHLKSNAVNYLILDNEVQLCEISQLIKSHQQYFILGGGSNIIVPENYHGLIIHNKLIGKTITDSGDYYHVTAKAGEVWDDFVLWCIEHGAYGLENLSLIPGTVGASPVQNIGAYGVEVKDYIENITVYDLLNNQTYTISNQDCQFSYRNSILKNKVNLLVTQVTFKLPKIPPMNCNYGDIRKQLDEIISPNALDLRNCIINTRQAKLPDPEIIGNAGSFFHNPIIDRVQANELIAQYPKIPTYATDNPDKFKISAGWLIDNLGLKGYKIGNVGVYEKQALVLVNYGDATKNELLELAYYIQQKVFSTYNIKINIEPIQI